VSKRKEKRKEGWEEDENEFNGEGQEKEQDC
jgi:hypothetical protein